MSRQPLILALTFTGFLAVVGLQAVWPFIPLGKLKGAVEPAPAPTWAWATIRNGAAFRAAEKWYDERAGLRSFWVRLDNQITYTFFGETAERPGGTRVVAGAHDWLFERHYIKHAITGRSPNDDAAATAFVARVRSVQDKLAARGIPFLLIVAPNKAEIYPEHVPAAELAGRDPAAMVNSYEYFRPQLQAAGVKLYDGPGAFLDWKRHGERNLFARSGTHWSYQAALHVAGDLRNLLNPRMRRPMPPLVVRETEQGPAQQTDTDLLDLLNLIVDAPYNHPQPFPVMHAQQEVPTDRLPRILWVHDSFGWPLINLLYKANAMQPSESLYYFKNIYHIPSLAAGPDIQKIDWEPFLKDYDAVVMIWTEIAFNHYGWGFFEAVDKGLP